MRRARARRWEREGYKAGQLTLNLREAWPVKDRMLTVSVILAVAALICTVASAIGKCPLWVAVVLLCVLELLQVMPLE